MEHKKLERKQKEDKPVLAICYDFDKTLSPDDMQAQGYIQSVGYDVATFWSESNGLAEKNDMDQNLAYMFTMRKRAHGKVLFTRKTLKDYGSKVKLFPGVKTWFERMRKYGLKQGVIVEHYIISSGLKEMIEGTSIATSGAFEKIYANAFYWDDDDVAQWPAQVVNYTNKTQFLFRIVKGVLDVNDFGVNEHFLPEDIRVPFRNIVYIGDSDTDIPCMKLVNTYGGHSIGVYDPEKEDKTKVYKMMREDRIKYYVPADYSKDTELENLIKTIIDRTATNEKLEEFHYECKKENITADKSNTEDQQIKINSIMKLEGSRSFASTHSIISDLEKYADWDEQEIEWLCEIALENSQVLYILGDNDVERFYKRILKKMRNMSEKAKSVKDIMDYNE